ncbi:MAG: methionine biosynthesis protein MetW [Thermodesulfobacteriota bacterium]
MSEGDLKQQIIRRFDELAPARDAWREKNRYYYKDRERYMRFLVPEGSEVLELGCGTGELLNALKKNTG